MQGKFSQTTFYVLTQKYKISDSFPTDEQTYTRMRVWQIVSSKPYKFRVKVVLLNSLGLPMSKNAGCVFKRIYLKLVLIFQYTALQHLSSFSHRWSEYHGCQNTEDEKTLKGIICVANKCFIAEYEQKDIIFSSQNSLNRIFKEDLQKAVGNKNLWLLLF